MDLHAQLAAMLDLAEELGLTVRAMPAVGDDAEQSAAALVRLKGREVLFLNAQAPVADRLDAVAAALAGREDLQNRFLPPELRERIERPRA